MNHGYTKLFGTLVTSSVWALPDAIRIVWITMLALADKDGVVWATVPGLAGQARVSLQDAQKAIEVFSHPDKWSGIKEDEGRRIREVDGGWQIVSYATYKEKLSKDARREYQKRFMRERRSKMKREEPGLKAPPKTPGSKPDEDEIPF